MYMGQALFLRFGLGVAGGYDDALLNNYLLVAAARDLLLHLRLPHGRAQGFSASGAATCLSGGVGEGAPRQPAREGGKTRKG